MSTKKTHSMSSTHQSTRHYPLAQALSERILILDGGMGTMIQSYGLGESEYRGERLADHELSQKGNNDLLSLTQPHINLHCRLFYHSLHSVRAVLIKANIQKLSSRLLHYLTQILAVSQWRLTVNIPRPETYQLYQVLLHQ